MDNKDTKRKSAYKKWLHIFLFITILFAFIEWASNAKITSIAYGLFALGILLLFTKLQWGILFYISVCLLSSDTPGITEELISVHTISIGNFSIMVIWTLAVFFILIYVLVYENSSVNFEKNIFDRGIIYLGGLFTGAALIGISNLIENPRIYISDASFFINMAIAYFAVRMIFYRGRHLNTLFIFLVSCIGVRALAGVIYYILGIGAIKPHIVKPVTDSSGVLFHFLPLLAIAVLYFRGIERSTKYILIAFAIVGTFNVLFYASRGNLILMVVSIILLGAVLKQPGQKTTELFRKTKKIFFRAIVLIVTAILIMNFYRPGSINYIWYKIRSTIEIDYSTKITSAGVRWLEAKNITSHLWNEESIIWGEGLGGWFSDNYFPYTTNLLGGDAYPDEWILQNKLYKPHGSQLFIFLKMGIMGIIIYFGILLWIFVKGLKLSRDINHAYWRAIISASVIFLLTLYYKNFTSKLQIFFGILLAIISNIYFINYCNNQTQNEE